MLLEELSSKLALYLPENMIAECQVGSFNKGCLLLIVSNAAWASQLRYFLPELRDKLRKEAGLYQLSSIKISIKDPEALKAKTQHKEPNPLTEKAKATLISESELCNYQPLKKALLHLAQQSEESL